MAVLEKIGVYVGLSEFIVNIIAACIIFLAGIFIGILIYKLLVRALDRARVEKAQSYNFLKRFITVIQWSVYILFLSLALRVLGIPKFTSWMTDVLILIPALVGGLLLIAVGFVIASYLRESIEESKLERKDYLGKIFYYFVLYIFLVFALKTSLISIDSTAKNMILIIMTAVVAVVVAVFEILNFRVKVDVKKKQDSKS